MDSNSGGSWRSNENTDGTPSVLCRRGRLSADVWAGEKGGEGDEDAEKEYLQCPGP